ncbi:MAG: BNR/Asp-box repeat protein, partial [Phycisphaerales bacterium]|nr:BNR/Asp-box repeat protein [Phycisphaerales bacterium]
KSCGVMIEALEDRKLLTALSVGTQVDASKIAGNQLEAEIGINPTNANNVVIAASNQNSANSSSLLISRSFDGGKTWTYSSLGATQDHFSSTTPRVDPHMAFDSFGNLYVVYEVASSSSEIRVMLARSSDGGATFTTTTAVSGQGLNIDYPILATGPDATNLARQTVWVGYTDTRNDRVRIVGARSTGKGNLSTFTAPVTVGDASGSYGSIAVGPLGQVVVAWQNNLYGQGASQIKLDVDADGLGTAKTWGVDKTVGTTNVGGWDYIPAQPNRSIDANVGIAFDRSNSSTRGRLYLVYADENGNESNDTNIMLRYSDTLGSSWSSALKVNNDATNKSQFLPAMAVDQSTGNVGITWRDARNSVGNNTSEVWGTVSVTHGTSVLANVRMGNMSNQAGGNATKSDDLDYGDYQGVAFANGKLIPVFGDNSNSAGGNPDGTGSKFDLYTVIVTLV